MYSLKIPKVTGFFIKHVDCRNLKIEKETNVRLSILARRDLNLPKEANLSAALEKIKLYQEIYPAKYKLENLNDNISKVTVGEKLFGSGSIALCAGLLLSFIGANFGAIFGQHPPSNHVELVHLFFEGTLFSASALGTTIGIYHSRRNAAYDLLHYFGGAEKQPVAHQESHASTGAADIKD
jgi:hypothetical protein